MFETRSVIAVGPIELQWSQTESPHVPADVSLYTIVEVSTNGKSCHSIGPIQRLGPISKAVWPNCRA